MYIHTYIYMGFHKWWYPIAGWFISWKIPLLWLMTGGTSHFRIHPNSIAHSSSTFLNDGSDKRLYLWKFWRLVACCWDRFEWMPHCQRKTSACLGNLNCFRSSFPSIPGSHTVAFPFRELAESLHYFFRLLSPHGWGDKLSWNLQFTPWSSVYPHKMLGFAPLYPYSTIMITYMQPFYSTTMHL